MFQLLELQQNFSSSKHPSGEYSLPTKIARFTSAVPSASTPPLPARPFTVGHCVYPTQKNAFLFSKMQTQWSTDWNSAIFVALEFNGTNGKKLPKYFSLKVDILGPHKFDLKTICQGPFLRQHVFFCLTQ